MGHNLLSESLSWTSKLKMVKDSLLQSHETGKVHHNFRLKGSAKNMQVL